MRFIAGYISIDIKEENKRMNAYNILLYREYIPYTFEKRRKIFKLSQTYSLEIVPKLVSYIVINYFNTISNETFRYPCGKV